MVSFRHHRGTTLEEQNSGERENEVLWLCLTGSTSW